MKKPGKYLPGFSYNNHMKCLKLFLILDKKILLIP